MSQSTVSRPSVSRESGGGPPHHREQGRLPRSGRRQFYEPYLGTNFFDSMSQSA
ncbi:hypothetical protein [Streptomyces litchfieldiae]|uniref:Uncharacterized protein n=1 Tax=Streptomyces litchfieldiae TaxID=3075543 RepID=A0ABU2MZI6_9ACTN|nr:hypothetical protein [Streptomyces sp. DSM 44938]MDT0346945.1 hypothetical protein [Streptomyces sp. DSM 44938]